MGSNLAKVDLEEALSGLFSLPGLRQDGEIVFDPSRGRKIVSFPVACTPDPEWSIEV